MRIIVQPHFDEYTRVTLLRDDYRCGCVLWEDGTICASSDVWAFREQINHDYPSAAYQQEHKFSQNGAYIGEFWLITMTPADRAVFQMRIEF